MKRKLVRTADGSVTLFVQELSEHYHSVHGAFTESMHIYIDAGFMHCNKEKVRVLEFGMGTGLNTLATIDLAAKLDKQVYYHAVEKYPLTEEESLSLHFPQLSKPDNVKILREIHSAKWDALVRIGNHFELFKEKADFHTAQPPGDFDVIYFDAFAPDVQPDLWNLSMFKKIFDISADGAVLTTYSSKGSVKRNLLEAGFSIEKLPGPPGKREFLRARKVR